MACRHDSLQVVVKHPIGLQYQCNECKEMIPIILVVDRLLIKISKLEKELRHIMPDKSGDI